MSNDKLIMWQRRLAEADAAYSAEVAKMDEREQLYAGQRDLRPLVPGDWRRDGRWKKTSHVRNIIFENVESQVSSEIPQPKVTPRRKKDEHLADVIEHFLRNELDRLPFETINDMAERTVPIQGAVGFLVEWDNTRRSGERVGEVTVTAIHPKQFAPQPGIYTGVEDMDWFILKMPTTKQAVRRRYGVRLDDEGEAEPDVRGSGNEDAAQDAVTRYIGYQRGGHGGIDRYVWVGDHELEDLENYQARRGSVCERCGQARPLDESAPCPACGGDRWTAKAQEFETIMVPIQTAAGTVIPGARVEADRFGAPVLDETGAPVIRGTQVPFYQPDLFPIIIQKSVSVYGKLLGNSDVDVIRDQQNTVNRVEQKIIDRLMKAGTRITLPDRADIRLDPDDGEKIYIGNAADKALLDVYDFTGNLEYELAYLEQVYKEAQQELGITDSYLGRKDATATSGKAKEFSAAQAAGRLESKRTMKDAAYAAIFELMFKFALAYSDEPRPVSYKDSKGETRYEEFDRYDFLERGEDGRWRWNDQFLFSCDTSAPLASNREAMWQETRMNLQTGAFGDPAQTETLILFWSKMEELHYPGAGTTKSFLEDKLAREQQAARMQALQQQAMQRQAMQAQQAQQQRDLQMEQLKAQQAQARAQQEQAKQAQPRQVPDGLLAALVQEQARRDAARDAGLS